MSADAWQVEAVDHTGRLQLLGPVYCDLHDLDSIAVLVAPKELPSEDQDAKRADRDFQRDVLTFSRATRRPVLVLPHGWKVQTLRRAAPLPSTWD